MLTLPASVRVFIARGATDLRRSFDRLSAQVQEVLHQDRLSGHVCVLQPPTQSGEVAGVRATGVRYLRNRITEEVSARDEVVLCGGAINSPQLLMLSGIGPADHLRSLGIPVLEDLPGVGRNLQDHAMARFRCWTSAHRAVDTSSNLVEAGLLCTVGPGLIAPELYFHFLPVAMVETQNGKERARRLR